MADDVTYDRPVKATLIVRLDNGDEWEAGPEDYPRFGLGVRLDLYVRTAQMLADGLGLGGFDDLTDHPGPNLVRYIIECGICYRHSPWADENGKPWPKDEDDIHGEAPTYKDQLRAVFATTEATDAG